MDRSGEFPSPIKEKAKEPEAIKEYRSVFRWMRDRGYLVYAALALNLLPGEFKHDRIERAKIPPGATWMQGINTLHNGVLSDNVETQAMFYIDNQTHRGKWVLGKEGESNRVTTQATEITGAINQELSTNPTQSVTVCDLHNHPLEAGKNVRMISQEEAEKVRAGQHSVSLLPSSTDISILEATKLMMNLEEFGKRGITVEARRGVVDAAGTTYHRPIEKEDLKREFPDIFAESERREAIYNKWEEASNPLISNLDEATLDKLHLLTKEAGKYDVGLYKYFSRQGLNQMKRIDLKGALGGGKGGQEIAQILLADNPEIRKLYDDLKDGDIEPARKDWNMLKEAKREWLKASMTVTPEQLTSTREYTKLRESFAKVGAYVRFASHSQIANEPPCAGTDYKP